MIARQAGSSADLFRVDDTIYGVAELVEVHSDRIVLRRGDVLETLRFPGTGNADQADTEGEAGRSGGSASGGDRRRAPPASSAAGGSNGSRGSGASGGADNAGAEPPARTSQDATQARLEEEIREAISQVQARAASDPTGLLRQYGLEATGEAYRVTSRASVLIANGLRPGDRITEINDQPVGNVEQDRALIDSVLAGDEIKITLERGGATYRIYQALPE